MSRLVSLAKRKTIPIATIYIDNLHSQIYCEQTVFTATIGSGITQQCHVGLHDFGELPATSHWYIRKIVFAVKLHNEAGGGVQPESLFSILGGIAPTDSFGVGDPPFSELGDYQDVNGFPLAGVKKLSYVQLEPTLNQFSWTKTWTPSKNLALNREQDINLAIKNLGGNDLSIQSCVYVHAERDN